MTEPIDEYKIIINSIDLELKLNGLNKPIKLIYPNMNNSDAFWDMTNEFMNFTQGPTKDITNKSKEEQLELVIDSKLIKKLGENIAPKINKYLLQCIEYTQNKPVNKELEDNLYVLIIKDIENVMLKITELINNVLPSVPQDQKKNILETQKVVLPKE